MVRSRLLSSAALEVCRLSSRKARSLKGERGRETFVSYFRVLDALTQEELAGYGRVRVAQLGLTATQKECQNG